MSLLAVDAAAQSWLDELPAVAASLDTPADVRLMVVGDALDAGATLSVEGAHPVLAGRVHLANAALSLLAADVDEDPAWLDRAVDECTAAAAVAMTAAACGVRLELLPRTAALLASCSARVPISRRKAVRTQLVEITRALGEALTEEEESVRHGQAMLAASQVLADGALTLKQKPARIAVLGRCLAMATEARTLLSRAGEIGATDLADETIADLETALAR